MVCALITAPLTALRRPPIFLTEINYVIFYLFKNRVLPTALSSSNIGKVKEMEEQYIDTIPGSLLSSKEETPLGDDEISKSEKTNIRKRLFFNLFSSNPYFALVASPATSYVFVPTTILKTVSLGGLASVLCLPVSYTRCT
jgi:hypothetical protein